LSLRQAIAKYLYQRFEVQCDPKNEVLVTVGASEGLDLALRTLVEPATK
jgi:aminotransferase